MAPEGQKPSQWLCLTKLPREMYSHPMVHKALSWGAIRKSACILAAITLRQRHPLEGSCQEAIRPPYTTFDNFFRCVPIGKPHPPFVISDASVFSLLWRRLVLRRTSHPSGSRLIDVSRSRQTSAPGTVRAPETPRCPAGANRIHRTAVMAPSRVQLVQGSPQRRRKTPPSGGRPSGPG
jgi:hypothetical protein